jgi:hypothetical protein
MPTNTPFLPRPPLADGYELADRYGNRWRYDVETNSWVSLGTIVSTTPVDEQQDGLATTAIYAQLQAVRDYLTAAGSQALTPFKIVPGTGAYWYFFHSSDKCVRFIPESESRLRIEVDQGRIHQLLSKAVCRGMGGAVGEVGDAGPDGIPGALDEPCFRQSVSSSSTQLDFAIFVPVPLTLGGPVELPNDHVPDISLRLYRVHPLVQAQAVEPLSFLNAYYKDYPDTHAALQSVRQRAVHSDLGVQAADDIPPFSGVWDNDDIASLEPFSALTVLIDPTGVTPNRFERNVLTVAQARTLDSIHYDTASSILYGSIVADGTLTFDDNWCLKARQRGPDGRPGAQGQSAIAIVEQSMDSTQVLSDNQAANPTTSAALQPTTVAAPPVINATAPLVSARFDPVSRAIYTLGANLSDRVCIDRFQLTADHGTLLDPNLLKARYAAAEMVLDDCQRVMQYTFDLPTEDPPELSLFRWDPLPGCWESRHYSKHRFDWFALLDDSECSDVAKWFSPTETRKPTYPWEIMIAPGPDRLTNCKDDLFYCANIQDGACTPADTTSSSPSAVAANNADFIHKPAKRAARSRIQSFAYSDRQWQLKQ